MRAGWGEDGGWWWGGFGRGRVCAGGLAYYPDFSFLAFSDLLAGFVLGGGGRMETAFVKPSIPGVSDRQASGKRKWLVCVRRGGYLAAFLVLGREDKRRDEEEAGCWGLGCQDWGNEPGFSYPSERRRHGNCHRCGG